MSDFTSACLQHPTTRLRFRSAVYGSDFLRHQTERMAGLLTSLGFRPGDIVLYHSRNNPFLFPLLMAADTLRGAVLCLDDRLTNAEIAAVEHRLSPQYHFYYDEQLNDYSLTASPTSARNEHLGPELAAAGGGIFNLTSGTTGPASLIFHDFTQTLASLRFPVTEQSIRGDSRTLSYLSYTHSGGLLLQTLPTLIQGGTLEIEHLSNLKNFLTHLSSSTHFILVPSVYYSLKKMNQLAHLHKGGKKTVVTGSSTVPPELFHDLSPYHDILNVYGLTEITPFLFFSRTFCDDAAQGSLAGSIIPSHEYILKEDQEIAVRGPLVGRIYDPKHNGLRALGAPPDFYYHTGDVGRESPGGLMLTGRKKMIINYRGFKFSPSEIENIALRQPNVRKCAVKKETDPQGDEYPVLYLELQESLTDHKEFLTALEGFLRSRLSPDKMPRTYRIVEKLPETLIGKNDYGKIP